MLLKLSGHIANCVERAASAEQRARQTADPATRSDNELLAQSWHHLALSYQFVESLERFLAASDRNTRDVVPPDMLPIVEQQLATEEQPAAPESRPAIRRRRRRVKHTVSFEDRLLQSAQAAREKAARLPAGAARDRLLAKARQNETAVNIDRWMSAPGSPRPGKS